MLVNRYGLYYINIILTHISLSHIFCISIKKSILTLAPKIHFQSGTSFRPTIVALADKKLSFFLCRLDSVCAGRHSSKSVFGSWKRNCNIMSPHNHLATDSFATYTTGFISTLRIAMHCSVIMLTSWVDAVCFEMLRSRIKRWKINRWLCLKNTDFGILVDTCELMNKRKLYRYFSMQIGHLKHADV